MSFILSTDTSCDILRGELRSRCIEYRPLIFTIDEVEHFDEFSRDEDYKGFYDEIRAGKMPTTSQINVAEHEEFFETLLDKYDGELVHITLSSGLSSTYASACKAAENVTEKTGRKIHIVDSLGATIAQRQIVDEAERLRDAGDSAEAAAQKLREYANHIHTWFMPNDLMHLKRGGRVSGPAAYIGTALKIKPILYINKVGGLSVVQKVIGVNKAMAAMQGIFKRDAKSEAHKVYIANADSSFAEEFCEKIKQTRPDCDVEIGWIGPVIGAHTGSGAIGVSFYSEKVREI
ncbi:MAG: DegV family protein [Roseburia sp.]|nr:DegV family protein [Roseburia sp.]